MGFCAWVSSIVSVVGIPKVAQVELKIKLLILHFIEEFKREMVFSRFSL